MIRKVLYFQPIILFSSSITPYAVNLDVEMVCARGMGSCLDMVQQMVWMARGVAMDMRDTLPGRSGSISIVSSM